MPISSGPPTSPVDLRRHAARGRGFTLVELVLAAALAAIVLVSLQSVVMIAAKAVPTSAPGDEGMARSRSLGRLALDLSYAKTVSIPKATELVLTVADRTGDAADDTIRYSWSGTTKDPLVRRLNGTSNETLLSGVTGLTFAAQTKTVPGQAVYVESSELLLASYSSGTSTSKFQVDGSNWLAQQTPMSLPADAVDFRTTRVRLYLEERGSSDGTVGIDLVSFRNRLPTTRVIATGLQAESALGGGGVLINCTLLSPYLLPSDSVGLVIRSAGNPPVCEAHYYASGAPASAGSYSTTSNAGTSWTTTGGRALGYAVYGVYRTPGTPTSVIRATSLRVVIDTGAAPALELNLALPNQPEVPP